jgi:RNA polymerase sigma-70 factor, ECF subfamily
VSAKGLKLSDLPNLYAMKKDCDIFEVWEQYKKALLSFIQKRVQSREDAKDILHDVLLKSYQFCAREKTVIHLRSWLYKVTINAIIDYHKHQQLSPLEPGMADDETGYSSIGDASDYIKELLKLLPPAYGRPLYMSDIEGCDQTTIAQSFGLSLSNTKSRIQRARVKLKELFLECCEVSFNRDGEMTTFDIKPHCKALQVYKAHLEEKSY